MAGPFDKQPLETQSDLLLQQKFKSLSGQQPEANVRILQIMKICDLWIPSASYNIIQKNLETLSWSHYFKTITS